jgi:hypothetical protein
MVNLTGFTGGITADEAGMNVESVKIKASSKKIEVPNKLGSTRGTRYHDKRKEITVSGETTAAPTAAIGAVLVVANDMNLGGITTGAIIVDDVEVEMAREGMQKVTINATQCEAQTVA